MSDLESRIEKLRKQITQAETRSNRERGCVCLMGASKYQKSELIQEAIDYGITDLGENYVQEAVKKKEEIRGGKWHLIGPLQSNKVKLVVGQFETIQSVDRLSLLKSIDQKAQSLGVIQNILIQVKLGDEDSKSGVVVTDAPSLLEKAMGAPGINLFGLMSLPPIGKTPEESRPYFAQLKQLQTKWESIVGKNVLRELSIGTTFDFEVAIEEGATMVRVGTALFGERR